MSIAVVAVTTDCRTFVCTCTLMNHLLFTVSLINFFRRFGSQLLPSSVNDKKSTLHCINNVGWQLVTMAMPLLIVQATLFIVPATWIMRLAHSAEWQQAQQRTGKPCRGVYSTSELKETIFKYTFLTLPPTHTSQPPPVLSCTLTHAYPFPLHLS